MAACASWSLPGGWSPAGRLLQSGANRDEVLARPATALTLLAARSSPHTSGGGTMTSPGGTWLAVNEFGVFGEASTNQPLGEAKDP